MVTRRQVLAGLAAIMASQRAPAFLSGARGVAATAAPSGASVHALRLDGTLNSWSYYRGTLRSSYKGFSVSLWAQLERKSVAGNMRSHMLFSAIHGTLGPAVDFRDDTIKAGYQGVGWDNTGISIDPYDRLHHYAVTYDSSSRMCVYIDGSLRNRVSITQRTSSSTGYLSLGGQNYSGTVYDVPKGVLANVELFGRVLDTVEVSQLSSDPTVVGANPEHLYLFDRAGTYLYDDGDVGGWNVTKGASAELVQLG